eukprot:5132613-Ditylum_brightwellii.AAC.1
MKTDFCFYSGIPAQVVPSLLLPNGQQRGQIFEALHKKYAGWSSNLGYDYPRKVFLQIIKCRLNLAEDLLTTHFAWRSAATALADGGILVTNLKQA